MLISRLSAAAGAALLAATLGACGASDSAGGTATDAAPTSSASTQATSLTITDPWVMAAPSGMTAAFGTLVNASDQDVTVVSATSDITDTMELHETVQNSDGTMAMQPKKDGFVVPAGGEHELAPGGDHLMVMKLDHALEPGQKATFTLTLGDGSTMTFTAVAKKFTGADEKYQHGDDTGGDMGGMDMGSSESPSGGM